MFEHKRETDPKIVDGSGTSGRSSEVKGLRGPRTEADEDAAVPATDARRKEHVPNAFHAAEYSGQSISVSMGAG
jgi:hypothetical protein